MFNNDEHHAVVVVYAYENAGSYCSQHFENLNNLRQKKTLSLSNKHLRILK